MRDSPALGAAYRSWDWAWLDRVRAAADWLGPAYGVGTAMVVGQRDATMTPHFDSHGNIVLQIYGEKEVTLWPPEDTPNLYPFPTNHPATRQAMLNPESFPRFGREAFPLYRRTRPQRGTLRAGDALYLPLAWWHLMRCTTHLAISVSFWHDSKRPGPYAAPPQWLRGASDEAMAPHTALLWTKIESMVKEAVGDAQLERALLAMARMKRPADLPGFDEGLKRLREFLQWLFAEDAVRAGKFVERLVAGRFGVEHDRFVHVWYLGLPEGGAEEAAAAAATPAAATASVGAAEGGAPGRGRRRARRSRRRGGGGTGGAEL